jgi:hypothetical protein
LHFASVFHCNPFGFLHPFGQSPEAASRVASIFRIYHLKQVAGLRVLAKGHFQIAFHFIRFVFRHQFTDLAHPASGIAGAF